MKQRIVIALVAALLPAVAATQESGKYHCTYGDLQRRVEIAHEPGVEVPCSVHYYKDTEMPDEQQVLWSADRDPTYCQTKAAELVTKLEGWADGFVIQSLQHDRRPFRRITHYFVHLFPSRSVRVGRSFRRRSHRFLPETTIIRAPPPAIVL